MVRTGRKPCCARDIQGITHIMRKVTLAALAGLGLSVLAAPSIGHAAIFSIAPAIQAAALDQVSPMDEVRATTGSSSSRNRSRNRSRGQAHGSRSTRGSTASTTR